MTIVKKDKATAKVDTMKIQTAAKLRAAVNKMLDAGNTRNEIAEYCGVSACSLRFVMDKQETRMTLDRLYCMSIRMGLMK